MLNSLTICDITENARFYLADYMAVYGVSLRKLSAMQIAHQPEFTYGLAMAFLQSNRCQQRRIARLKMAKRQGISDLRSRDILEIADIQYLKFEKWVDRLIDSAELVQPEGGRTRSTVLMSFGFSTTDTSGQDMWAAVRCKHCGNTEVVPSYSALDFTKQFQHVSGPYVRCNRCDNLSRAIISESPDAPPEELDVEAIREEWEMFRDYLGSVLDRASEELSGTALGKPDLYVIQFHQGATRVIPADGDLAEALQVVNAPFAIKDGVLRMDEEGRVQLDCKIAHHDSPLGQSVTILPGWSCELDEDYTVMQERDDAEDRLIDRARVAETLLCGPRQEFEFNEDAHPFKVVSREGLAESLEYLAKGLGIEPGADDDRKAPRTPVQALAAAIGWLLGECIEEARANRVNTQKAAHLRGLIDCYLENA